jgi:hypothetical protein
MELDFEMLRSERRSFTCPNKLWKEIEKKTDNCISISTYIRNAIIEKMMREDRKNKEYYASLLIIEK